MVTTPAPTPPGAVAAAPAGTGTTFTRWLGALTLVAMAVLTLFGLVISPADQVQGDSVRILYVHVGTVWVAYLAFVVTAISSAAYLWRRTSSLTWDRIAGASAEIGVLFMAVTLLTGALWGRISWGTFWVWDARVTTTAFLFITYVGYLAVRGLGGSHQQRARRSAVVALLAVLEIPLVHFSVKLWRSVHQDASVAGRGDVTLDDTMLFTLLLGVVAFTMLYAWYVLHRQRVLAMEDAIDDKGLDLALAERRREATTTTPTGLVIGETH
ncbi:MAG: cytochrome c biogenesis protein CcsA [Acidimicrobiales bacterium]|nr:cytochrome c biogenesis protein CcsA [Acidimicrobiales bacterium]MCB9392987.1 cytochrome c biogenesis protein CcsA [Acidimicrobiaceae bacterium]